MSLVSKGRKFDSYEELSQSIENFQFANFFQLWVRDSKTIKSYSKKHPSRQIREELKYVYLHYCCVHGGKKFESKSTGARPNTRTLKDCCPAEMKVSLTKDGNHLEVVSMQMNHNHECNEASFNHLPKQRKLDPELKKEASMMISQNCNRKMLQSYLQNASGRVVTSKDLSNLKKASSNGGLNETTFEDIALKLCKNKGSTTEVVTDADSCFLGIYYQDSAMKAAFEAFPEIMFVDASFKVKCGAMWLYLLLGPDGNGVSEIFAHFLIKNEEEVTVRKMISVFKETNPSWSRIVTIVLDKDFTEREIFTSEFPNAGLLLCLLHVQKTFKEEVTTDRMGITNTERHLALEMLQKMSHAKNEEEYDRLHLELKYTKLQSVFDYFEDNWHPIREHWVERFKMDNLAILNRSNNLVDSTNSKIRLLCKQCVSVDQFVDELLLFLQSLRTSKDLRAISICQRKPVLTYRDGTPEAGYQMALTPYAFYWLRLQYNMLSDVKIPKGSTTFTKVSSYVDKITVTESSCQCTFWTTMQLPCRHIMAFRRERGLNIYDSTLFAVRWTLQYYQLKHPVQQLSSFSSLPCDGEASSVSDASVSTVLTQGQKYKKSYSVCQKIASLMSECPMDVFNDKLEVLNKICHSWAGGVKVSVLCHASETNGKAESGNEEQVDMVLEGLQKELQNDTQLVNVQLPEDVGAAKELLQAASTS